MINESFNVYVTDMFVFRFSFLYVCVSFLKYMGTSYAAYAESIR